MRSLPILAVVLVFGCGDGPGDTEPIDPSAAAGFRGYAAVEDDLRAKFLAPDASFELYTYLGDAGVELSRLTGRPDGFGVSFEVRNKRPNAMNVLVWRMMLEGFARDLAATCPGSTLPPVGEAPLALSSRAAQVTGALCSWPQVSDAALGDAWTLVVGRAAPAASRDAFVRYARTADLQSGRADDALPQLWLGALLHPAFLLEQ
jgi:hypothetical protein